MERLCELVHVIGVRMGSAELRCFLCDHEVALACCVMKYTLHTVQCVLLFNVYVSMQCTETRQLGR